MSPSIRHLFRYVHPHLEMDIDNTSLEHFTTCARASEYRLVYSREGTTNMAAKHYGSAKHIYLENRLRGELPTLCETRMFDYLATHPVDDPNEWRTISHAIEGMRAYERYWQSNHLIPVIHNSKPLVEIPFRLPLCDVPLPHRPPYDLPRLVANHHEMPEGPFPQFVRVFWTGRIDAIVNHLENHFVCDHKTTSMVGPSFFDDFHLSSQTLGYTWASRHAFPDLTIMGLLLNTLIGRKPTKSGTAHDFARQTYIYSNAHLDEWHKNTQTLVSDFLSHLLRGYFPMQTKWCMGKYGTCQYHAVCTAQPGHPRNLALSFDTYQDVTWSPLNER